MIDWFIDCGLLPPAPHPVWPVEPSEYFPNGEWPPKHSHGLLYKHRRIPPAEAHEAARLQHVFILTGLFR